MKQVQQGEEHLINCFLIYLSLVEEQRFLGIELKK